MHSDSTLRYDSHRGFGEALWIICPVCWNSMKVTSWEDGSKEEECLTCERIEREASATTPEQGSSP